MFFDEVTLTVMSGSGGGGSSSFRREKFIPFGGPNGGNGGRGGNAIIKADSKTTSLIEYKYKSNFKAENGKNGSGSNKTGASGEDLILRVPVGTQVFNEEVSLLLYDLSSDGDEVVIALGGKGGLGNINFKTSVNQAPRKATKGEIGQQVTISLRTKLFCDVGIIGKPNAGKSTFLSKVTNAKPKIADYPFTTLSPNMGVVDLRFDSFVIADIPGLIEGASQGVGLGDKFLKHIERCEVLLHILDCTDENPIASYKQIRKEIEEYDKSLCGISNYGVKIATKHEIVAINKIEMISDSDLKKLVKKMEKATKSKIFLISNINGSGIKGLLNTLYSTVKGEGKS